MGRTIKFLLPISLGCLILAGCGSAEARREYAEARREYLATMSPLDRCMENVSYENRNAAAIKECREAVTNGAYQ